MKDAKLVDTYSSILYNRATSSKSLDKVIADIKIIVELIESRPDLMRFFIAPIYQEEDKLATIDVLDKKIKMEKISKSFFRALVENNRVEFIRDIYEKLVEKELLSRGLTRAILTSARSMSSSEIEKCKAILEKRLDKKFDIKHIIDKSIIAGVILKFSNNLYDISVSGVGKNLSRKINEI